MHAECGYHPGITFDNISLRLSPSIKSLGAAVTSDLSTILSSNLVIRRYDWHITRVTFVQERLEVTDKCFHLS